MRDDLRSRVAQQFREFALEVLRDYDVDPEIFTNDPDALDACGVWADAALAEIFVGPVLDAKRAAEEHNRVALAEMGGVREEYCAKCGAPRSNHPYRHLFEARKSMRVPVEMEACDWTDKPDDWTDRIKADFYTDGFHSRYAQAMDLVSNRHSKSALVALVCYLLRPEALEPAPAKGKRPPTSADWMDGPGTGPAPVSVRDEGSEMKLAYDAYRKGQRDALDGIRVADPRVILSRVRAIAEGKDDE